MSTSGQLPLKGLRILVGRAAHQANVLSEQLRELGAQVLEIPFIEIRQPTSYQPLDDALHNIASYSWLILTSVNGVEALFSRLDKDRLPADSLRHLHVAAIGPASRKAIEKRGLTVEIMPEQYVAESVVKALGNHISGERILLARAKEARDVIPNELRNLGATVDVIEAYETVLPEASKQKIRTVLADKSSRPDIITFTSSSSVKNFFALAAEQALDGIKFASIGPVTSATLRELQLPVHIEAEEYTIPGLVQAIVEAHCLNHEASSSR